LSLRGSSVVSSRPWRVITVLAVAFAISATTTNPAGAATADCEQIMRQEAEWLSRGATSGVPPSLLVHLRTLGPSLTCGDPELEPEIGNHPEYWRPLVALYFEPEDVDRAICLMGKESNGDPDARNPSSGAAGLMQVMPFWARTHGYAYADLFMPGVNLWVASQIRDQQGWWAWSPYVRGLCR